VHVLCCPKLDEQGCGITCPLSEWGAVACSFILIICSWHSEPDVEAFSSGIVSAFVIRVGVAEAVVACGQKAAHSLKVAKPGEVCFGPRLILFRGVCVGVGRGCGGKVKGESSVAS